MSKRTTRVSQAKARTKATPKGKKQSRSNPPLSGRYSRSEGVAPRAR